VTSLTIHRATKSWLIFIAKVSNEKWMTNVRKNMTNFILKRRKPKIYDYIFCINFSFLARQDVRLSYQNVCAKNEMLTFECFLLSSVSAMGGKSGFYLGFSP